MSEKYQSDLTAAGVEEGPSSRPETVVFGSDNRSEEFVATLARETEAALLEGMAGLPGDVDRPQDLVETFMVPYKQKMDVLERFCRGSVFSIGMYDRSKQNRVVAALLRYRADPDSEEFLLGNAPRLPATEGSVVGHAEMLDADGAAAVPASADDIPTDEQVSAAQNRVANLRARLSQAKSRRDELEIQLDEWRSVRARAVGAAAENAEGGPALLPPLGADDAATMHDVVSSVVVGASTLADLHQQGEVLLSRLQETSSDDAGDGRDEAEGTSTFAVAVAATDLPKAKTLEEKYAEDRAAIDGGGGGGGGAAAPSATVKQLLRLLRTGKENSVTPFQAVP